MENWKKGSIIERKVVWLKEGWMIERRLDDWKKVGWLKEGFERKVWRKFWKKEELKEMFYNWKKGWIYTLILLNNVSVLTN